ncbi:MAG: tungstate ABC transporter substrate-binding protein WtpA [Candidatus Bipolaricaulota bacterium]
MNRRNFLTYFGVTLIALLLFASLGAYAKTDLKVFHAGSLTIPFSQIEQAFEEQHPDVDVQLEGHGSVVAVRQVTEVGQEVDVVAVADYSLLPSMMLPDYADFYLQFAKNRMVVAYTDEIGMSDVVNSDNWYNVLAHPEVRYGFSDPNMDPCGYRSLMVMQLAEAHYLDDEILEELVIDESAITVGEKNGNFKIHTPEALRPNTRELSIREKSVDLVAMAQEGGLDYAFEYMSVAKQHGLNYVTLPEAIDLSSMEYADTYRKVSVEISDGNVKTAKPIVYGITIPSNAPHPELAAEFVKLIISEAGQGVFSELGQPPIVPARAFGETPAILEDLTQ